VSGDDLVDAAGEWKLVPNRLVHERAETIVGVSAHVLMTRNGRYQG
jgi:hypothetical protein